MRWCCSPLHLSLLFVLTLLLEGERASGFRICSYNLQKFNARRALNYRMIHTLTRVVSRCDICLLQNVVDPTGEAIKTLLKSLNRYDDHKYRSVSSEGLGKSPDDMQQYVFIYRTQTVNVTDQYQYIGEQWTFVRKPFAVQFHSDNTTIKDFILVPLHTDPAKAVKEMDHLYDVFEDISKKWNNSNVMFLGDFHAGCAYMTRSDKRNIRLFTNSSFSWLIGDKVDTTVTDKTNCPYDRIVIHGTSFLKEIQPFSAQVYNFGKELKVMKSKVLAVSDHYPVEVRLKSSVRVIQATPLLMFLSLCLVVQSFLSL